MKIYPAIDIQDGHCVRLKQGDFNRKEVFSNEPEEIARRWASAGADMIHVVDLDGALIGKPVNHKWIGEVVAAVDIPVQVGGGIRDLASVEYYFSIGVSRIILGTTAVQNLFFVKECARKFPDRIVAGVDARDGKIAISGWKEVTNESAVNYGKRLSDLGICALVYTDIERDGMMQGPSLGRIGEMARSIRVPLVVSGGISSLQDIEEIKKLENIEGVIIGKALYNGAVDLKSAVRLAKEAKC